MESFHSRAVVEFPSYDNITRILDLLNDLDLVFVQEARNSIGNIDKYTGDELLAAANIGVYMTDIGYMWSYGVIDDALNYNIFVFALADQLGMNMDWLESLFQRYNKEDADPDSILSWIGLYRSSTCAIAS